MPSNILPNYITAPAIKGDSIVKTSLGLYHIQDLAGSMSDGEIRDISVDLLDYTGKLSHYDSIACTGERSITKVELACGMILEGTYKLCVTQEGKTPFDVSVSPIDDMKRGDSVLTYGYPGEHGFGWFDASNGTLRAEDMRFDRLSPSVMRGSREYLQTFIKVTLTLRGGRGVGNEPHSKISVSSENDAILSYTASSEDLARDFQILFLMLYGVRSKRSGKTLIIANAELAALCKSIDDLLPLLIENSSNDADAAYIGDLLEICAAERGTETESVQVAKVSSSMRAKTYNLISKNGQPYIANGFAVQPIRS